MRPGTKHPFLSDIKVREAMALAIDKETMVKQLYGPTGEVTHNVLTTPGNLASKSTKHEFNIEKANKILDDAGYKKGGDGIRMTPDGIRMKVVFQTSINSLRQKEQAIVKDGWQKIGIETELKSVDAASSSRATRATRTSSRGSRPTSRCSPRRSTRRSRSAT